jgi:hypothetical protein
LTIRIGLHSGLVTEGEGKLTGPAVSTAARIAGIARRDQILCSSLLVDELPQPGIIAADPMPKLGTVAENGVELPLFQIHWPSYQGGSYPLSTFGQQSHQPVERLCIRYRGKAFLVDEKTPVLTIGRDPACKLAIDDRKASRQHARVERRNDGFYLIDTSTNGSFVTLSGRQEVMLRRNEMALDGKGKVSFGTSSNDPQSDLADFEHL